MIGPETLRAILLPFGTAFGMIIGAAWLTGLITFLTTGSPIVSMLEVARSLRIWAMAAAMGGTFPLLEALESTFSGDVYTLLRHLGIFTSAALGAWCGWWVLNALLKL
ncbi:MAG: hypothetical protein H0Z38_06940 [Firmicutes bacterium]|nr:hypothetical protein [Bacillota bacterium]